MGARVGTDLPRWRKRTSCRPAGDEPIRGHATLSIVGFLLVLISCFTTATRQQRAEGTGVNFYELLDNLRARNHKTSVRNSSGRISPLIGKESSR